VEEKEREAALDRLLAATNRISDPGELAKLARDAELLADFEASMKKARELASRTRKRKADTALVNYDDALAFGRQIGLTQQRMSRFWSSLHRRGRFMRGNSKDSYQAAEISIKELRQKLHTFSGLSESERMILEVWLLNL